MKNQVELNGIKYFMNDVSIVTMIHRPITFVITYYRELEFFDVEGNWREGVGTVISR